MLSAGRRAVSLVPRWLSGRQNFSRIRVAAAGVLSSRSSSSHGWPISALPYQRLPPSVTLYTTPALLGKVVPFNLPETGEGIDTVDIKEWMVKPGDNITMGDPICKFESDKATDFIYAAFGGVVSELMYEVGDTAFRDKPLIMVEVEEGEEGDQQAESSRTQTLPQTTERQAQGEVVPSSSERVLTTPAVRKIAMERGINLSDVAGTGKEGRVLKEDMLRHIEMMEGAPRAPPTPPTPTSPPITPSPPPITPLPPPSLLTQDRTERVKGFQAVMAKTMTASGKVPQFGYCDEVDVTALVELRNHLKSQLQERGDIQFSYMPIIIKAVSMALHRYPVLNSTVDPECTAITYRADHNIGIAMDTAEGLVVPKIKQVQNKSVFEIAVELNRLHDLGSKGELPLSDLTGGTFSLSNIGAVGGTYARPLLLPPEVAIGALGKIQVLPRFGEDGSLRKAHIIQVSWSADHRVIDGATVARFSKLWKSYMETPASMIVDLK